MRMERLIEATHATPHSAAAVLAGVVVAQVERARALVDQNPASATYGCADRTYWYYRTLTNFPGATWQQLMVAFAALYRTEHPANPFQRDPQILALAGATLNWWATSQHADGAFDEWYLNEHSYCPTAITGAGAALTMHLLGGELPAPIRTRGINALARAAAWLDERYNEQVSNQNLAAVVAMQGLAHLTASDKWHRRAVAKLERIRRDQDSEGWFPEYGGMDFGYSALALDLLAAASLLGAGALADEMARALSRCLASIQGAGLGTPGRIGSRGTSHAFPFGAIWFARSDPAAAQLAQRWLSGLAYGLVPRPESVDDRYFAYFYLPQFALALHAGVAFEMPNAARVTPEQLVDLPHAGLVLARRERWSLTANRNLGGALALQTEDALPLYHLGYEVTTRDGRRYSSAVSAIPRPAETFTPDGVLEAAAQFRSVSSEIPLRRLMIPFQIVVHVLRSSRLAEAFQSVVKRRMVAPARSLPLRLQRRIQIEDAAVRVQDTLVPEAGLAQLAEVRIASCISMHSPSTRQEAGREVTGESALLSAAKDSLNAGRRAVLNWTWNESDHHAPSAEISRTR
jgi:hypothetical protein